MYSVHGEVREDGWLEDVGAKEVGGKQRSGHRHGLAMSQPLATEDALDSDELHRPPGLHEGHRDAAQEIKNVLVVVVLHTVVPGLSLK